MTYRQPPPMLDLLPDGRLRPGPRISVAGRVFAAALVVAVLGTVLSLAALAFWIVTMLVPVVLGAAAVAWIALKVRRWQGGSRSGSILMRRPPRPR